MKTKNRKPTEKGKHYSQAQKLEAVKLWLLTGNLVHTAAALNMPEVTIKSWRYSDWWDELVKEVKSQNSMELSAKLRKIVEKSHEQLVDRLDNGDWVFDQKNGKLIRKPIAARDLSNISNMAIEKHLKIESKPAEDENQQKIMDRLAQLAESFAKMSQKKVEVTDVIFVEEKNALPN